MIQSQASTALPHDGGHRQAAPKAQRSSALAWFQRIGLMAMSAIGFSACSTGGSVATGQPKADWGVQDIPSQQGRVFVVTGGTSGIGYESAKALAAAGAQVVIAARGAKRGEEAIARIRQSTPDADVQFQELDLADLASVRALGTRLTQTLPRLDGLINNAGLMEPPQRLVSADGLEMQFAVNYLGHFALTAELLPLLRQSPAPRVITLSSIAAAHGGQIHLQDLQFEHAYDAAQAYSQSKLACLMFALELQRRSDAAGWGIQSIATHPGVSRTNLLTERGGMSGFVRRNLPFLFQPAPAGAVPTLYAATAAEARGGQYYGPTGLMETRGPLGLAQVPDAARDARVTSQLWLISQRLSGAGFPPLSSDGAHAGTH